jgi:hypothetical protein
MHWPRRETVAGKEASSETTAHFFIAIMCFAFVVRIDRAVILIQPP